MLKAIWKYIAWVFGYVAYPAIILGAVMAVYHQDPWWWAFAASVLNGQLLSQYQELKWLHGLEAEECSKASMRAFMAESTNAMLYSIIERNGFTVEDLVKSASAPSTTNEEG